MGEAMIFVVDSDEAVGQCDDEDMRKLEALAANQSRQDQKQGEKLGPKLDIWIRNVTDFDRSSIMEFVRL